MFNSPKPLSPIRSLETKLNNLVTAFPKTGLSAKGQLVTCDEDSAVKRKRSTYCQIKYLRHAINAPDSAV